LLRVVGIEVVGLDLKASLGLVVMGFAQFGGYYRYFETQLVQYVEQQALVDLGLELDV
jgi:hypothetical protein